MTRVSAKLTEGPPLPDLRLKPVCLQALKFCLSEWFSQSQFQLDGEGVAGSESKSGGPEGLTGMCVGNSQLCSARQQVATHTVTQVAL